MSSCTSNGSSNNTSRSTVCVLDASSYVGFWLVKSLLRKGYAVHAAIAYHNSEGSEAKKRLHEIEKGNQQLTLFAVDVLDYHSIIDCLGLCSALLYCFEPSGSAVYNEGMAEMEIRGAHNVLEACAQVDTIEKIIFTSSVSAMVWKEDPCNNSSSAGAIIDEKSWSDPGYCRKLKLWQAVGKTLAERTAWALAMDRGLTMVTVNAPLVVGPSFSSENGGATLSFLRGAAQMYDAGVLATVDVRFVARVQAQLLEDGDAFGRYVCYDRLVNSADQALALAAALRPLVSLPDTWQDDDHNARPRRLHDDKLRLLLLRGGDADVDVDGDGDGVGDGEAKAKRKPSSCCVLKAAPPKLGRPRLHHL